MSETKVVTGKVRLSYARLFELDQDGNYSTTILIPKTDAETLKKIAVASQAAIKEGAAKLQNKEGKIPDGIKVNLKDGDGTNDAGDEYGPECKGHYTLKVKSKYPPTVIDSKGRELTDPLQVYSGCYARVSFVVQAFNYQGTKKGLTVYLGNVMKVADGEPLGASNSANNDFAEYIEAPGADDPLAEFLK